MAMYHGSDIKNKKDLVITRSSMHRAGSYGRHGPSRACQKWWGPKAFTAPVVNIDLRVGGKYLSCMRDPDNKDY
jgi:hypothetical protein